MEMLYSDFRKGVVKLRLTSPEDVWYITHLIDPGDRVTGRTTRKIKIGSSDNALVTRKPMIIEIVAETIELSEDGKSLRVNGKIMAGPDDVPKGLYHALALDEGAECTLHKASWRQYQKQKLQEACEKKHEYLLCLLDRETALLARTRRNGYEVLATLQGEVAKKNYAQKARQDFYDQIRKSLEIYAERFTPEVIILASPAFYKEEVYAKCKNQELRAKIILATCSDVTKSALDEVMRSPELENVLHASRVRQELLIVDELLKEINKDNLAAYGWEEVRQAAQAGAIKAVLLTTAFLQRTRASGEYEAVDTLLKGLESQQSEIHFISTAEAAGKLEGLGGIAALLRYKLQW